MEDMKTQMYQNNKRTKNDENAMRKEGEHRLQGAGKNKESCRENVTNRFCEGIREDITDQNEKGQRDILERQEKK